MGRLVLAAHRRVGRGTCCGKLVGGSVAGGARVLFHAPRSHLLNQLFPTTPTGALGRARQPIMAVLGPYIRPGDTVWEAGAHIGSHTIGLAAMVSAGGANGRVHTWEPNAESRGYLHAALVVNGYGPSTVTVHDEALGGPDDNGGKRLPVNQAGEAGGHEQREDNSGSFSFVGVDPGGGMGGGGGGRRGGGAGRRSLDLGATAVIPGSVPIASLDALMAEGEISGARCPSVIKSDAEGYDFRMLAGAAETIALCKPVLYFEVMRPRASLADLEATVLKHREPGYTCAWHLFRLLPKSGDMFRPPGSIEDSGEPVGRAHQTSGPMSYNLLCVPEPGHRTSAGHSGGARMETLPAHLPRLVGPATDLLYAGPQAECLEYDGDLRREGLMLEIVGSHRSICERGPGARNAPGGGGGG